MAVNTDFYGSRDKWLTKYMASSPYETDFPDDEKIKLANFFNDTVSDNDDARYCATLGNAIYRQQNGGVPIPAFYDNSICFTGVGGDTPYRKIKYISNREMNKIQIEDFTDENNILPVMWSAYSSESYAIGTDVRNWTFFKNDTYTSDPKTIRSDFTRWKPDEIRLGSTNLPTYPKFYNCFNGSYESIRNYTSFITQFPVRKIVFCIYVQCCKSDLTDFNSPTNVDLDTFLSTTRTTKPVILSVYIKPYGQYKNTVDISNQRTSTTLSVIFPLPLTAFNDYYVGQPDSGVNVQCDNNFYNPNLLNINGGIVIGGPVNIGVGNYDMDILTTDIPRFNVGAYVDCNSLQWDSFADQDLTGHHVLYCDSSSYTVAEIRESCRRATACFGVFFTDKQTIAYSGALDHTDMMCGTLVDGIGYGDYTHGADNQNQDQYNWSNMEQSPFDPNAKHDPNSYNGTMGTGYLTYSSATTVYNVSGLSFVNLASKLWDAMSLVPAGDPLNEYVLDTFLCNNPIDAIVSLKYFPVSGTLGGTDTTIKLGKYDTNISAKYLINKQLLFDCGSYYVYPTFGSGTVNWIDKMCTITLYLPFCGTLELNPEIYFNRYVNVEYAIDLQTGNCSAFVSYLSDNGNRVITDVANGNCAIDCPVTGIQHITLDGQLYNATEQLKSMRVNNAVSGLQSVLGLSKSDSLIDGLGTGLNIGKNIYNMLQSESVAEYNLQHTQLPIKMIGTTGATTGAMCTLYPTIIFERPKLPNDFNESAYAHTVGYSCCVSGVVGDFTGYAEFANADLSNSSATATEKNLILRELESGVIL
jgi:hypothetical protein